MGHTYYLVIFKVWGIAGRKNEVKNGGSNIANPRNKMLLNYNEII